MKNLGVIVGVTAFIFSSSVLTSNLWAADSSSQRNLLPNLPPWEIVEPPPSEIIYDPPIYLDVDSKGNVYRLNLVKSDSDGYKYSYEVMTAFELDEISSQREIILENMEHRSLPGDSLNAIVQQSSTSTCPLPSNFAIAGNSNGEPVGNVSVLNTYRPVDATTQWIVFDFWTQTFRDRGAHVPIVMFFTDVLQGWGAIIGDNHDSPTGCGSSARFNSQIEGFLSKVAPPAGGGMSEDWQSVNVTGPDSCGNEMYDGYIGTPIYGFAKYRFEMQASTGHWVAYRIMEWSVSQDDWTTLTDWKVFDVDTANWPKPPHVWTPDTQGILVGGTAASEPGTWYVNISDVQCGWF